MFRKTANILPTWFKSNIVIFYRWVVTLLLLLWFVPVFHWKICRIFQMKMLVIFYTIQTKTFIGMCDPSPPVCRRVLSDCGVLCGSMGFKNKMTKTAHLWKNNINSRACGSKSSFLWHKSWWFLTLLACHTCTTVCQCHWCTAHSLSCLCVLTDLSPLVGSLFEYAWLTIIPFFEVFVLILSGGNPELPVDHTHYHHDDELISINVDSL